MEASTELAPVLARRLTVFGSTGSVGAATLDVVRFARSQYGEHAFPLEAITAHRNAERLIHDARELKPKAVVVTDPALYGEVKSNLARTGIEVLAGSAGLLEAASRPADMVMSAIVGAAGLAPTLTALERGAMVALANKECVVAAGAIFRRAAQESRGVLIPVDSEHNAVFQCVEGHPSAGVSRIILTASGGAFRDWPPEKLSAVTPADALKHPNWAMGPKITVDSATLANKGLELIEAQQLFGLRADQCDAVIHPQSIVHGLVEFNDGAMLAQLCPPSMTFPIQHALLHPHRAPGVDRPLDLKKLFSLEFRPIDETRFPMLALAKQTMRAGGIAPAIYNAANEVAVAAFLEEKIPFLAIPRIVEETLAKMPNADPANLDTVLALDLTARRTAEELLPHHRL
jgi:1-deoxy-D-xylulose-5-phosphate reductoisomerase